MSLSRCDYYFYLSGADFLFNRNTEGKIAEVLVWDGESYANLGVYKIVCFVFEGDCLFAELVE
jgi:hypothetical protein